MPKIDPFSILTNFPTYVCNDPHLDVEGIPPPVPRPYGQRKCMKKGATPRLIRENEQ